MFNPYNIFLEAVTFLFSAANEVVLRVEKVGGLPHVTHLEGDKAGIAFQTNGLEGLYACPMYLTYLQR